MSSRTRVALVQASNSVGDEDLGWMRVVFQYALDVPWVKMEPATNFIEIYELVEQSVTFSEAPSLMVKVLDRLHRPCSQLTACVVSSSHKNNAKLEFVLTLMDIVRDLPEENYKNFAYLAKRRYFENYHLSKFYPRYQLVRRLLGEDIIGPMNFGVVYAFLESVQCSGQHCKLDRYCEEQGIQRPVWESLCVQTDPTSLSEPAEFLRGDTPSSVASSVRIAVTPMLESGVPQQETTASPPHCVREAPSDSAQQSSVEHQYTEGRNVLVTGHATQGADDDDFLERAEPVEPGTDLPPPSPPQPTSNSQIQQVSRDGPVASRPPSTISSTHRDPAQATAPAGSHEESETSFSHPAAPDSSPAEHPPPKRTSCKTKICWTSICCAVPVLALLAGSITGTLIFGVGLQQVNEVDYIGGNVPVLLHPPGFDQFFVKSVTVTGYVPRTEEESAGTFFLTPCDSLLLSTAHFANKSLGTFTTREPHTISILNYFGTDEPVLSQKQPGNLTYYTTAQANQSYSNCPISIIVFDNEEDYNNYQSGGVSPTSSTNQSDCLLQDYSSDQPPTTFSESNFVLLPGKFYFALLSLEPGVEALISAMFTVTEYNVSHLEPLSCHLTYNEGMDDQCTFSLSNGTFSYQSHKQCLIGLSFSSLSPPYFNVSITTTANLKMPCFIGFLILDFISIITIAAFLVGICILCFKSRNRHGDYETL